MVVEEVEGGWGGWRLGGGGGVDGSPFLSGADGLLPECLRVLAEQLKGDSDRQQGRSTHRALEIFLIVPIPASPNTPTGDSSRSKT